MINEDGGYHNVIRWLNELDSYHVIRWFLINEDGGYPDVIRWFLINEDGLLIIRWFLMKWWLS